MTQLPLKWHGGKGAFNGKLAQWIISLMPPHVHYVEPYFGGGAVLLHKDPEGVSEVVNDINGHLTDFWRTLQHQKYFEILAQLATSTPFSMTLWDWCHDDPPWDSMEPAEKAMTFLVLNRQSQAGRMKEFAALSRNRTRRGMNEQVSAWLTAVEGLPEVHARLKRVAIIGPMDGIKAIKQQDGPNTLFYCDPTYLHETRVAKDVFEHEMTPKQHCDLLETLGSIKGKFLLSGYPSRLYVESAAWYNWRREEFKIPNNAAGGQKKRTMTECVWMNY